MVKDVRVVESHGRFRWFAALVVSFFLASALVCVPASDALASDELTAQARHAIDVQALSEIESISGQVTQVALGDFHSAALMYDGSLWMWGYNKSGNLGNGSTSDMQTSPEKVLTGVVQVSLGANHSAAVKSDGTLWAWGGNAYGQVGDGTETTCSRPVQIMSGVSQVALGKYHSAAVKIDGTLWAWGANGGWQLGDGTSTNRNKPVQVLTGVRQVALGDYHSAAVKTDGSLWLWGDNGSGQIGDGTTSAAVAPKQVMTGVSEVSLGASHSGAVTTDGTLWMWGSNKSGRLGDSTTMTRYQPTQVMTNVKRVALGSDHSSAIRTDNALWMWGSNIDGKLGYETIDYYRAVPAISMRDVTSMSLGSSHTAAICTGGSVWVWGQNKSGQLGVGSTSNAASPRRLFKGGDSIASATVSLSKTSYTYDGKAHTPSVTVTNGFDTLVNGTHYTVSYANNKNAGTATVTITGIGQYFGSISKTFAITAVSLGKAKLKLSNGSYAYNGKAKKPATTVMLGSKKLKKGTDYVVTYSKGLKNVGKYKVKITGKHNYKGSLSKSFVIVPQASAITSVAPLRSSKSGAASVSWKKVSRECDGYELWLSTSKKFIGSTKKVPFKSNSQIGSKCSFRGNGLAKKTTYYVKVRTYKSAGGKKYYSKWSGVKSVTTL